MFENVLQRQHKVDISHKKELKVLPGPPGRSGSAGTLSLYTKLPRHDTQEAVQPHKAYGLIHHSWTSVIHFDEGQDYLLT